MNATRLRDMTNAQFLAWLGKHDACPRGVAWVRYGGHTPTTAFWACTDAAWLRWFCYETLGVHTFYRLLELQGFRGGTADGVRAVIEKARAGARGAVE